MGHLIGPSGIGKGQFPRLIKAIMRSFRDHDKVEYKRLEDWQRQKNTKGANKDKPERPEVAIWWPPSDVTNAAFLQNAIALEKQGGRTQYLNLPEIEMADDVTCQGIFDSIELIIACTFADQRSQVRFGYFNFHSNTIINDYSKRLFFYENLAPCNLAILHKVLLYVMPLNTYIIILIILIIVNIIIYILTFITPLVRFVVAHTPYARMQGCKMQGIGGWFARRNLPVCTVQIHSRGGSLPKVLRYSISFIYSFTC